jgi:hypothetical protein
MGSTPSGARARAAGTLDQSARTMGRKRSNEAEAKAEIKRTSRTYRSEANPAASLTRAARPAQSCHFASHALDLRLPA